MADIDAIVIGAGIIGLSSAYYLSQKGKSLYIIEKENRHGQGISSRNSEVIHACIYYPPESFKCKMCLKGKYLLYEFLEKYDLPYIKRGKYIVATDQEGMEELNKLKNNALNCMMKEIQMISHYNLPSSIRGKGALFSPTTGVFNVHYFMDKLVDLIKEYGNDIVYGSEIINIEKTSEGFKSYIKDTDGEITEITSEIIINAAGLNSDKIARFSGKTYTLYPCKGTYFSLLQKPPDDLHSLVYPIPEKKHTGLGIHLTIDTGGRMKLGPDTEYIKEINYKVDEIKRELFYQSVKQFLPWVQKESVQPDMSGIRPKLQGPNDTFKDYIIENINGFINLVGIESPGLTASLAIGEYVSQIL